MGNRLSKKHQVIAFVLLFLVLGTPLRAHASPVPVRIDVDASKILDEDAAYVARAVRKRMGAEMGKLGYPLTENSTTQIKMQISYLDEEDYHYAIHIDIIRDGERVSPGVEWFTCLVCPDVRLIRKIAESAPKIAAALSAPVENAGKRVLPDADTFRAPPRITVIGIAGAVVAAGGIGLVGWGAPLISKETGTRDADIVKEKTVRARDYGRRGVVLVSVGAVFVVVGVVALVTDILLQKKKRKRQRSRAMVLPSGFGAVVRF